MPQSSVIGSMGRLLLALFVGVCLGVLVDMSLGSAQVGGYGWKVTNSSGMYGRPVVYQPPLRSYNWNNQRNNNTGWNYQRNNSTGSNYQRNNSTSWNSRRYPRSAPSDNGTHSFYWGTYSYSSHDRLLYSTRVTKDKSFLRKVTLDVEFPSKHQKHIGTISYIQVIDEEPLGKGGYATIKKGGIGQTSVTLHFMSQINQPFDFSVNIYGH